MVIRDPLGSPNGTSAVGPRHDVEVPDLVAVRDQQALSSTSKVIVSRKVLRGKIPVTRMPGTNEKCEYQKLAGRREQLVGGNVLS
jgi:hypothetical protein